MKTAGYFHKTAKSEYTFLWLREGKIDSLTTGYVIAAQDNITDTKVRRQRLGKSTGDGKYAAEFVEKAQKLSNTSWSYVKLITSPYTNPDMTT